MKRKLIAVGLVLGLCLGVIITRAVWQGRSALSRGDDAFDIARTALANGEVERAANQHRRAIEWWRRAARFWSTEMISR